MRGEFVLSWRLLSVLLALLVLSATVAPLSAGLASGRGEELVIERLVVLDLSGRVKRVESLGWRVLLARQLGCPSCVRPGLEVLMERLVVLVNESRTAEGVAERLTAVRLERVVRDPSRPCPIYVGLDVAAYARETPTYKASVVLLNYRSPRGGYVGSVAFVKVFPLDREPAPRGEVVVVERPGSVGRALGSAASDLGADPGSAMGRLGLVSAVSEAIAGLASALVGRVGELLERETGFLAVVFADPDIRHWRPDLALLGEVEPDPTTSDAKDPGDGGDPGECLTDQDYWSKGYSIDCFCTTGCTEVDQVKFLACAAATVGMCTLSCLPWSSKLPVFIACVILCAFVTEVLACSQACLRWENLCFCPADPGPVR